MRGFDEAPAQIADQVDEAAAEIRSLMTRLLSWSMTAPTFEEAVRDHVRRVCGEAGARCSVRLELGAPLSPRHAAAAFRTVQEEIAGARDAAEIGVRLEREGSDLLLEVRSTGSRAEPRRAPDELNRRRLEALGGRLEVRSRGQQRTVRAVLAEAFARVPP
jgi:signal transduction histidine kinase